MKLIGMDPGYARFGVAVVSLFPDRERVDLVKVLCTEKTKRVAGVAPPRVADDMRRRMREISLELAALCDHDVVGICIENAAPPFGRTQTSVVSGLGRARGLIDMLAAVMGLPVIESGPQALKRAVTGQGNAEKSQVQLELQRRYPELRALWPRRTTDHEHAADAVAAVVAGLDHDLVRELRTRGAA